MLTKGTRENRITTSDDYQRLLVAFLRDEKRRYGVGYAICLLGPRQGKLALSC